MSVIDLFSDTWVTKFEFNLSSFFIWLLMIFISFLISIVLSKAVIIPIIRVLFWSSIKNNEKKRLITGYPIEGITENRLHSIETSLFWIFILISVSGTLTFLEYYGALMCKLVFGLAFFLYAHSRNSTLIPSFFIRIYFFYNDTMRVGDIVIYNEEQHTIIAINTFETRLKCSKKMSINTGSKISGFSEFSEFTTFKNLSNITFYDNDKITFAYPSNFKSRV